MAAIYLNNKVCIRINRSTWVLTVLHDNGKGNTYWREEKHCNSLQSALHAAQQAGYQLDSDKAETIRTVAQAADQTLLFAEQGLGYIPKIYDAASKQLDADWAAIMEGGAALSSLTEKQVNEMMELCKDDLEVMELLQLSTTIRMVKDIRASVIQALTRV